MAGVREEAQDVVDVRVLEVDVDAAPGVARLREDVAARSGREASCAAARGLDLTGSSSWIEVSMRGRSFDLRLARDRDDVAHGAAVLADRASVDVQLRDGRGLRRRLGHRERPDEGPALDGDGAGHVVTAIELDGRRAGCGVVRGGDGLERAVEGADVERARERLGQGRPA